MLLLLDMLRADFTLSETYAYIEGSPLSIPVVAFAGLEDEIARPAEVEAWKEETNGNFNYHLLPGSHFFLHSARPRLLQLLCKEIVNQIEIKGKVDNGWYSAK
jgi:medium-chain acyl-[acyl-carrier-protein] hydrolase